MSSPRWRWPSATVAAAVLVVAGSCAALFVTNPTRDDYQDFAGETLVNLATKEVCERQTLPMVLQLWISDCPRLIADQEPALALLADQFTRRWNLGLASVYVTTVMGRSFLANHLSILAVHTSSQNGKNKLSCNTDRCN